MSLADKKTIVEFNNAVLSLTNILANGDWPEEIKFEKGKSPVEVHELVSGMFENDDETTLILDHLAPYVLEWEQVVKKRDASTIHKLPGNIGSVVNQLWVALDDDSKEGMWDELENICKCFQACRSWVSDQDKLAQIEQRLLKQSCQVPASEINAATVTPLQASTTQTQQKQQQQQRKDNEKKKIPEGKKNSHHSKKNKGSPDPLLKDVPNILGNFLQLQKDPNLQNDPQAAFDAAFAGSALGEPLRNIMKQFIPTSGNLVSAEQLVQNAKLESRNSSKEDKQPQKSTEENLASFYNVFNNDLVELLELIIKYRTKKFQDKIPEFRLLHLKLVETIAELKSLSLDKISKYANPVLDSIRKNQDTLKKYADELDSPHLWSQANLLLPETKVVPLNMLIGSIKSCKPDNEFRKLIREKMAQMYSRSQTIISLTDRYSGVAPIIGDVLNALENKEMQELDLNEIVSMVATPDTFNKVKNLSESVKDKSEEAMTDLLGAIVNAGTTTTNENKEKMKQKLTEFMQKGKEMANADAKEKELFYKQIMKDMQSFSTSVHEDEEQEDEEQEDVYDEKEDGKKAVEEKKTPTVSK